MKANITGCNRTQYGSPRVEGVNYPYLTCFQRPWHTLHRWGRSKRNNRRRNTRMKRKRGRQKRWRTEEGGERPRENHLSPPSLHCHIQSWCSVWCPFGLEICTVWLASTAHPTVSVCIYLPSCCLQEQESKLVGPVSLCILVVVYRRNLNYCCPVSISTLI